MISMVRETCRAFKKYFHLFVSLLTCSCICYLGLCTRYYAQIQRQRSPNGLKLHLSTKYSLRSYYGPSLTLGVQNTCRNKTDRVSALIGTLTFSVEMFKNRKYRKSYITHSYIPSRFNKW